jgi:hypothetical protein
MTKDLTDEIQRLDHLIWLCDGAIVVVIGAIVGLVWWLA